MNSLQQRTASRGGLVLAPLIGLLFGSVFGALCILLRAVGPSEWASLADEWWPWALVLGIAALASRSVVANLLAILATGLSGLTVYYVLKACLAVGYSASTYRGFDVYFQQDNLTMWSAVVVATALPGALAGAWGRRLFAVPGLTRRV
ncbi:hypothetical protein [Arthrobacter sp. MA-N2]|uniref:hypothetical protein n=1 Tax=Arthrobacter sp. MA-N2 TaxID=1101188 RepID=UPI000481421D|nr:hypothetical protein [Arthrobacter sp. MA-N2]